MQRNLRFLLALIWIIPAGAACQPSDPPLSHPVIVAYTCIFLPIVTTNDKTTTWIFVHLMFLINYRNRIRTFYNWVTAYFSKDQTLRMIIKPESRSNQMWSRP